MISTPSEPTTATAPADVGAVINEAAAATDVLFARTHLDRRIMLEPGLPRVHAPHDPLVEILTRLIASAVRFCEDGRVTIGAANQGAMIDLWVSDDGATLDEATKQAALETTDGSEGWADWLRWLTTLGGLAWIETSLHNGTTVRLSLPAMGENHG